MSIEKLIKSISGEAINPRPCASCKYGTNTSHFTY